MATRIILADDHAQFRETLRNLLDLKFKGKYVVIGEAASAEDALNLVAAHNPDVLLLDYHLGGLGDFSTFCKEVSQRSASTKILILSGDSQEEIAREAGLGGARGYVVKGGSIADLGNAITTVDGGGIWVDPSLSRLASDSFFRRSRKD